MSWLSPAGSAVMDARGRVWRWNPTPRSPAHPTGCYQHRRALRTRAQLEEAYGRLVALTDPRLLAVPVRPVPVEQVRVGHWVVVATDGAAGRVVGIGRERGRYHDRWLLGVATRIARRCLARAPGQPVLLLDPRHTQDVDFGGTEGVP